MLTAGRWPFVCTLIWDEDLNAPSERERETFISLEASHAVSGPYTNSTPATLGRVLTVSIVPLAAFPRDFSVRSRPRSCYHVTPEISRLFRYFRRLCYDFITPRITRHLRLVGPAIGLWVSYRMPCRTGFNASFPFLFLFYCSPRWLSSFR